MKHRLFLFVLLFAVNFVQAQNTQTFTFQGFVFQSYTIPVSGYYLLTSKGGEGGSTRYENESSYSRIGGKGASMSCYYFFNEGDQLRIAVAGAGQSVVNPQFYRVIDQNRPNGAGGGGASSIVLANGNSYLPVLIAGGGGGAGNGRDGDAAQVTQIGTPGKKWDGEIGGSAGVAGGGGGSYNGYGTGGGGAGYNTDGGTNVRGESIEAWGGQAYLSGNYGGGGHPGGDGGWGGGGEGGRGVQPIAFKASIPPWDGSGGGGGGYSGGGAGDVSVNEPRRGGGGGGGGSFVSPIANTNGLVQLPGDNSGNGVVTITGPNTQTDVVNTPFNPYTWPANGMSYSAAGMYTFRDSVNSIIRILDLSFGIQSCPSYTLIDTTIVSCGSYTSALNGRTYTENTTDSIRVGCVKYRVKLIVAPPAELLGNMITGGSSLSEMVACKNSAQTYTIRLVPYASSYEWTLPSGATGTSSTNSITVQFGNDFNGGNICVTPINDCDSGENICKTISLATPFPTGDTIQISAPQAPHLSGNYAATELFGATTYTWSVSNNEAVIVSGQGTPNIQLQAILGALTTLSVVAENCLGNQSSASLILNGTVSVEEEEMVVVDDITLYPNPSKGQFTLSTPSLKEDAILEVYSMEGRLVYQKNIPANTNQTFIDLQQPSAGLYAVRLLAGNKLSSMKIIVN